MTAHTADNPLTIEAGANRPVRRRSRLFLLLAVPLAALAVAALSYYPRSPYERYVTLPMGPKGVRISLLVPRGWKLSQRPEYYWSFELKPPEPMRWLPAWAKTLLRLDKTSEPWNFLEVSWNQNPPEPDTPSELMGRLGPKLEYYGASRSRYVPGSGTWRVSYVRSDKQTVMATYKTILDSVKVLQ